MTLDIYIPYWGDPDMLFGTVESVRVQTDPDWRLTVLDDCYPGDRARDYFAGLGDERVRYVRNPQNLGITGNFRASAQQATEAFVSIVGCDDLLLPNYVEVVRRTAAAVPTADIIQPGVRVIDEDGAAVRPLVDRVKQDVLAPRGHAGIAVLSGQNLATSLIRGDWLYWPSLAFRTERLRTVDFRDGYAVIQDLALLMDLAFAGSTLAYNPEVAFSYRRHADSASQTALLDGTRFRDERAYYRLAHRLARDAGWPRTARAARSRLISRLHGVAALPNIAVHGDGRGIRSALAHIVAY